MNCNFYQIAYSIGTSEPSHPDFKIFNQIANPYRDLRETRHMIDKSLLSKYIDIIDRLDDKQDIEKISNLITQINAIRKTSRKQNPLQRLISNVNLFFK